MLPHLAVGRVVQVDFGVTLFAVIWCEGQWVIFSNHVGPEDGTQVIRLGSRCLSLLSRLTSPAGFLMLVNFNIKSHTWLAPTTLV